MANANKQLIDLPFFELCNQAPVATQAIAAMTTSEDGTDRYIYYIVGITFYRYDTIADTWQLLAAPNQTTTVGCSLRYTTKRGFHGRVLSATSTTIQIPGLRGPTLDGQTIEILSGTGMGQTRVLTYTGETVHDAGVVTAVAANLLTDSLKKWKINQWAGYMVGVTFGTDSTQYKKILYNDTTTLYVSDINLQPHDPWSNQPYAAILPYALPVTTAGSQAHFQIMSSTFSVTAWTTTPDYTSFFTTLSGGIYLLSSLAGAPYFSLQYYDVIADSWQNKTTPQGMILAALGTDFSLERTGKLGSALVTNLGVVSGTNRTLADAGQTTLEVDRWRNHRIVITGGTGIGQSRRIVSNTAGAFTVNRNWDINPTTGSTYEVWPDYARLYMAGGAASALFAYSTFNDCWGQGQYFDDGITANITCTMAGWEPFGVTSGTRIAAGVQAINTTPANAGTGYAIGDTFSFVTGAGAGAKGRVVALSAVGVPSTIELIDSGTTTGYTVATSGGVTNIVGSGSGLTVSVTTVGPTANIVLASASWLKQGDSVTFAGCTEGLWNAAYTILGVSAVSTSACTFSVATTATANMAASNSQSTTVIVDPSKNWIVNEHVGRIVDLCVSGTAPTSQKRWITANTATTLTVATIVAGVNGTSKYCIYDANIFGCDDQRKEANMHGYGHASGGSLTTLTDSSKNWIPGQWIGYLFKVEAGTGYGSGRISITANTATTLTYTTQSFTPDATTRYEIADAWGIATSGAASTLTDNTKNWATNQWGGKRVRVTAGTLQGTETTCTANTATALTITGTPDTTSAYAIVSIPPRGAGIELIWAWGATAVANKKLMFCPRGGGSNSADIYDIAKETWAFGYFFGPQAEPFTTGSSYAYDGVDSILASRSATGQPVRVFRYNLATNKISGYATTTWVQGTAHIGNFMAICSAPTTGEEYLYCLQNTGTLMSRAQMFF